ncbi:hypothetical protein MWN33_11575 [Starkeya koreensis]|uniref:Uncharacterized protein n=1 Tax=Ancylobacter koreensis TaxID=266121 RepID=A0ABT0DN15_9HYPH|nr:hypothetical protein [Ancylobacter koreensis]MCK0208666.1 hypothetical protein [Ancylobacter koreensis]
MTVYAQQCTFGGTAPPMNAIGTWDIAYLVKYASLNVDLAARQPWAKGAGGGNVSVSIPGSNSSIRVALSGKIGAIRIVPGAAKKSLDFEVTITAAKVSGSGLSTLQGLTITVRITAALFLSSATGLQHLAVEAQSVVVASDPAVKAADGTDPYSGSTLAISRVREALAEIFEGDMEAAGLTDWITGIYAKDYREEVNLPWLTPKAVAFTTVNLEGNPPTDGFLAVLGRVDGLTAGLTEDVDIRAMPLDADVNAAVIINPRVLASDTYYKVLNDSLSDTGFADFAYDRMSGSISNGKKVEAFYRINAETGLAEFVTREGLANSQGRTFPLTIPKQSLRFSFGDDSIVVELLDARVDIGHGNELVLRMRHELGLVALEDGSIDLAPIGAPEEDTILTAAPSDTEGSGAAMIGAQVVLSIALEVLAFVFERSYAHVTSIPEKKIDAYAMDCAAAIYQAERENRAVAVNIGGGRRIVVSPRIAREGGEPIAFDSAYRGVFELKPELDSAVTAHPKMKSSDLREEMQNVSEHQSQENLIVNPSEENVALTSRDNPIESVNEQLSEASPLDAPRNYGNTKKIAIKVAREMLPSDRPIEGGEADADLNNLATFIYYATRAYGGNFKKFRDVVGPLVREKAAGTDGAGAPELLQNWLNNVKLNEAVRDPLAEVQDIESLASLIKHGNTEKNLIDNANIKLVYRDLILFINNARKNGLIGDGDYIRLVESSPAFVNYTFEQSGRSEAGSGLLSNSPWVRSSVRLQTQGRELLPWRIVDSVPIKEGLLRDFGEAVGREPGGTLSALKLIITRQPVPKWVLGGAVGVYLIGLAVGLAVPNFVLRSKSAADKARSGKQDFLGDDPGQSEERVAGQSAARLFGALHFPFMTQFDSEASRPSVVLKRAGINGGLILGVSVSFKDHVG